MMKTDVLPVDAASLARAASLLRAGELTAFPTETVYGLGANALDAEAVLKIFVAKERPADNPLIAHVDDEAMMAPLVEEINGLTRALMEAFWPGPLTLVLPRTRRVPDIVAAGLSTVGVRMPAHPDARAVIRAAGVPVAAPSANRSGRPSPTTAQHVLADMQGRIELILDGGPSGLGVESTVLDVTEKVPVVLRPGGITVERLRQVAPQTRVDPAVLLPLKEGGTARSPGMKHRHYAPLAQVLVVRGERLRMASLLCARYDEALRYGQMPAILCRAQNASLYAGRRVKIAGENAADMAAHLFDALRGLDAQGVTLILAEGVDTEEMGLAYMNRLLRAANFEVVQA